MSSTQDTKPSFDVTLLPLNMREKIFPSEERSFNGTQCWEWIACLNSRGYGLTAGGKKGKSILTHRKAWEVIVGEIPVGLTIDHLCFNKICVNTDHLEVVTGEENTRRAAARITHCRHGHPLSGENLRIKRRRNGRSQRECKTCKAAYQRSYRARRLPA